MLKLGLAVLLTITQAVLADCRYDCGQSGEQCIQICDEPQQECSDRICQRVILLFEDGSEWSRTICYCRDTLPLTVVGCQYEIECTPQHPYPTCQAAQYDPPASIACPQM